MSCAAAPLIFVSVFRCKGGAIALQYTGNHVIENTIFQNNRASSGAAATYPSVCQARSRAVPSAVGARVPDWPGSASATRPDRCGLVLSRDWTRSLRLHPAESSLVRVRAFPLRLSAAVPGFLLHRHPPPPNNSFKPTPCRGIGHVLYATLAHVRRPNTGRLNSGVRPRENNPIRPSWNYCFRHWS